MCQCTSIGCVESRQLYLFAKFVLARSDAKARGDALTLLSRVHGREKALRIRDAARALEAHRAAPPAQVALL